MFRRRSWLSLLFAAAIAVKVSAVDIVTRQSQSNGADQKPGTLSQPRVCQRWAQASALVNGKAYLYGGYVKHDQEDVNQTRYLVTREMVSLDLTQAFDISSPPYTGLQIPPYNGPPKVAFGSFWSNDNKDDPQLVFYGGLVEDVPPDTDILALNMWNFDVNKQVWTTFDMNGDRILRAAEGTAASYKGVGYYRGGHLDNYTTPGYPQGVRTYLSGMVEFDFKDQKISNVTTGFDGVFPTAVSTGYQDSFLVPITLNDRDYLINFGGGGGIGAEADMGTVYIYDIEAKKWFAQPVKGKAPNARRTGCATAAYAQDNSSVNIFVYGGKELVQGSVSFSPNHGEMWVLSVPSFTWIQVNQDDAGAPPNRFAHKCHLVGSNMVVIGGSTAIDGLSVGKCDGSTVYNYDTSSLAWKTNFDPARTYSVADEIYNIIGGNANGSASWDNVPAVNPPDSNSPILKYFRGRKPGSGASGGSSSKAAVIGGVVAGIGGIAIIGAAAFFLWRRKKQHRYQSPGVEAPLPPDAAAGAEMAASGDMQYGPGNPKFYGAPGSPPFLKDRPPSELYGGDIGTPRYSQTPSSPPWDSNSFVSPQRSPGMSSLSGQTMSGQWSAVGSPHARNSAFSDIAEVEGDHQHGQIGGLGFPLPPGQGRTQPAELA